MYKSNIEVLEILGLIIKEYFEYIVLQNEYFYLLVDEFMFENFLEKLQKEYGISPEHVYSSLRELKCDCYGKPYAAIAIASYQVMVFYTLDNEASSDAYNEKLFSSKAYKGMVYQEYWYQETAPYAPKQGQAFQEKLWALLKKSFKIANIPDNKNRNEKDRYVQFPKSQNLLGTSMHTFRIEYADEFIKHGLEPKQGITYEDFRSLFFDKKQDYYHEILKRLIFSFYCMWDGRAYKEILEHKNVTRKQREKEAKDEFLIQIYNEVKIYINKQLIDLYNTQIDDKYLYIFHEQKIKKNGYVFIKDDDYDDWMPYHRAIDPEEEVLVLTKQSMFPGDIDCLINKGEIEVISAGMYKVLILNLKDRERFKQFNIKLTPIPCFYLTGGIKAKRNTYYSFALPIVKLIENQNDKKYQSIYLDSKEYPIEQGQVTLPKYLNPGKHSVKLSDSWESAEVFFYVEDKDGADNDIIQSYGWVLHNSENKAAPSTDKDTTTIAGLSLHDSLSWIERNNVHKNIKGKTELRSFLQINEYLSYRFNTIENTKIEKRRRYGK